MMLKWPFYKAFAASVPAKFENMLQEKSWEYAAILKGLPAGAARLLKAVAKEGVVKSATGGRFIAAHSLSGASSVHLSLKKLLESELLYETDNGLVVYDRLFGMWLARLSE